MKAIHKKIIRKQAEAMRKAVTTWAPRRRHWFSKHPSEQGADHANFLKCVKHNNDWFKSVVAQVLAAAPTRKAALLRIMLKEKGLSPDWTVTDWSMSYDQRTWMAKFFGHKVTKLPEHM